MTDYMDPAEFQELGFLQEVNRRFLHPCGLALAIQKDDDGTCRLAGIIDARDDPEGIAFFDAYDEGKAGAVDVEIERHREARQALFGGPSIQPSGWTYEEHP